VDDEGFDFVVEYKPARYDKWSFIGLGLNITAQFFDGVSNAFGAGAVMALQHQMQREVDRKFKEIMSGK